MTISGVFQWSRILKKARVVFVAALMLVGIFDFVEPAAASIKTLAAELLFSIGGFFGGLMIKVIDYIIIFAGYNNFIDAPVVQTGWVLTRDIANMFYVFVFLLIAFGTMLKLEQYSWKKMLPRLLFTALMVNFSRLIIGVLIDFGQVVMLTFVNGFSATGGGNFLQALKIQQMYDLTRQKKTVVEGTGESIENANLIGALLIAILLGVSLVVTAVFAAILLARIIVLWILIALSPLAFLLGTFPKGKQYYDDWWKRLSNQIIVGPVLAFFLWLSLATVGSGNSFGEITENNKAAEQRIAEGQKTDTPDIPLAGIKMGQFEELGGFLVAIALLMAGLAVTQQLGVAGSGLAGGAASWLKSKATNVAKKAAVVAGAGLVGPAGLLGAAGLVGGYKLGKKVTGDFIKHKAKVWGEGLKAAGAGVPGLGYLLTTKERRAKEVKEAEMKTGVAMEMRRMSGKSDREITESYNALLVREQRRRTRGLVPDPEDTHRKEKLEDLMRKKRISIPPAPGAGAPAEAPVAGAPVAGAAVAGAAAPAAPPPLRDRIAGIAGEAGAAAEAGNVGAAEEAAKKAQDLVKEAIAAIEPAEKELATAEAGGKNDEIMAAMVKLEDVQTDAKQAEEAAANASNSVVEASGKGSENAKNSSFSALGRAKEDAERGNVPAVMDAVGQIKLDEIDAQKALDALNKAYKDAPEEKKGTVAKEAVAAEENLATVQKNLKNARAQYLPAIGVGARGVPRAVINKGKSALDAAVSATGAGFRAVGPALKQARDDIAREIQARKPATIAIKDAESGINKTNENASKVQMKVEELQSFVDKDNFRPVQYLAREAEKGLADAQAGLVAANDASVTAEKKGVPPEKITELETNTKNAGKNLATVKEAYMEAITNMKFAAQAQANIAKEKNEKVKENLKDGKISQASENAGEALQAWKNAVAAAKTIEEALEKAIARNDTEAIANFQPLVSGSRAAADEAFKQTTDGAKAVQQAEAKAKAEAALPAPAEVAAAPAAAAAAAAPPSAPEAAEAAPARPTAPPLPISDEIVPSTLTRQQVEDMVTDQVASLSREDRSSLSSDPKIYQGLIDVVNKMERPFKALPAKFDQLVGALKPLQIAIMNLTNQNKIVAERLYLFLTKGPSLPKPPPAKK